MQLDDPSPVSLKGSLILSDPSLHDPNFARTVLLLTEHKHDEGAHGYVLNRPLEKKAGDFLTSPEFAPLANVPIFIGGPVSQEQLTFASLTWKKKAQRLEWATHLDAEEAIRRTLAGEPVRAFLGYSGWAGGQLEGELKQRAWITCKPGPLAVRAEHPETLWRDILCAMGPWYKLLAGTPENPSLN